MHDTLISADIIGTAEKQGTVKSITVEVGDLGHLPGDELKKTLEELKPDWKISITSREAKCKCSCGYEGKPKILEHRHGHSVYECPECGTIPEITDGSDIILKEVSVE